MTPFHFQTPRWLATAAAAVFASTLGLGNANATIPVGSTPPSALGTFSGTYMGNTLGCLDPEENGPFSGSLTLSIDHQVEAQFRGTGFTTEGDSLANVLGLFSSVLGNFSGSFDITTDTGASGSGSLLSGLLDGDRMTFSFSVLTSDGCSSSGSASLTRNAALDTSSTGSSDVTGATEVINAPRLVVDSITTRVNLRRGKSGGDQLALNGVTRVGNGFQMHGDLSGLSSGDAPFGFSGPLGVWASYSNTNADDDFVTTRSDTNRHSVLAGVDTLLWDTTVVGVALGFEDSSIDTRFNRGEQESFAVTVAPYVGGIINDVLSYDVSVGYSDLDIDQYRTSPATGAVITSSVGAYRVFAAANANATWFFGDIMASGQLGFIRAKQKQDGYIESNGAVNRSSTFDVGTLRVGGELAYTGGNWEPYVGALYQYDYRRTTLTVAPGLAQPSNDDDDVLFRAGVRYFGDNGMSGGIVYMTILGRDNYDEHTFSANLRWDF